jgi:hypothetical protein
MEPQFNSSVLDSINNVINGKPISLPEVTVYGKKQYAEALDKLAALQQQYMEQMSKYKKDSVQYKQAQQAYKDSLTLFNSSMARGQEMFNADTRNATVEDGYSEDQIKDRREYYRHLYLKSVEDPKKYEKMILPGSMFSTYPYKQGVIDDRPVNIPSFIEWDTEMAEGYKKNISDNETDVNGMTNQQRYEEYSAGVEAMKKQLRLGKQSKIDPTHFIKTEGPFQLIYKKPTVEPTPPNKPTPPADVKYDKTYETLNMKPLWATDVKQNPNTIIGTLHPTDPLYNKKGFTIEEAMQFPKEVRDKYNIDFIYSQIKNKAALNKAKIQHRKK